MPVYIEWYYAYLHPWGVWVSTDDNLWSGQRMHELVGFHIGEYLRWETERPYG
jgi:hypothetical protein